MPDGSMIRLTVARYYTPTGRSIQKHYENGKLEDYQHDLIDRYNRGELMSADSIHFPDSMKYNTLETDVYKRQSLFHQHKVKLLTFQIGICDLHRYRITQTEAAFLTTTD